jgi:hypothetical protein
MKLKNKFELENKLEPIIKGRQVNHQKKVSHGCIGWIRLNGKKPSTRGNHHQN